MKFKVEYKPSCTYHPFALYFKKNIWSRWERLDNYKTDKEAVAAIRDHQVKFQSEYLGEY